MRTLHGLFMSKFSYIVASNTKYLPGLNALINSLDQLDNKIKLHVLGYNLPETYITAVNDAKLGFEVEFEAITQAEVDWLGEAEVLMRKRYMTPSQNDYDAVCILDADMFICQELTRYFIAANTGLILGCGMEQKRRYNVDNHQYPAGSGNYIIPQDYWAKRDLCCSPFFVGRRWYPTLKRTWDMVNDHAHGEGRFLAPEMDSLNITLIAEGAEEWIIPMNQPCWTGLHETLMKAHTRAIDMHGQIFTEDGQEVNIVHGQFWNRTWRGWQIDGQMGMIEREFDNSARYKSISQGSFEFICKKFKEFTCDGKISINDFLYLGMSRDEKIQTDVMEIT